MTPNDLATYPHDGLGAVAFWTGLSLILMLVLTIRVSLQRQAFKVSIGDGGHQPLMLAGRTFGNAVEYLPMGLVALVLVALVGYPVLVVHGLGAALFLGRVAHAVGMHSRKQPAIARMLGMILTYVVFLAAALLLVVSPFQ